VKRKLLLIKRTIPKCLCGCGKIVKSIRHNFIHGHNIVILMKNDPNWHKKLEKTMMKKYGVKNIQQIPEVRSRSVKTRKERYSHWMGNLTKSQIEEFKQNCSKGGKIGGKSTAKRWKDNPEEFNEFLRKGHESQKGPGNHYENSRGINNPMNFPGIREKHKQAVIIAMNKEETKRKQREGYYKKYGVPYFVLTEEHMKRLKNCYSKPHKDLFNALHNIDPSFQKEKLVHTKKSSYRVDIINKPTKLIIECYGDYWHCNPLIWNPNDYNKSIKRTAQEKWKEDESRIQSIQSEGFKVLVFWEMDIIQDLEQILQIIIGVKNDN